MDVAAARVPTVDVSSHGKVGRLRIDRPEKRNALTSAMYATMADALNAFDEQDGIAAAIVCGGDDFTAGNDLRDFLTAADAGTHFAGSGVARFLESLRTFSKPLIAAVRGNAIGIGTTMLLHCDAVMADGTARFCLPFAQLGLVPEAGASLLLPLTIGRARAARLLLGGETIGADEAAAIGLVTRVCDEGAADAAALAYATGLAAAPLDALRETKHLLRAPWAEALQNQMRAEAASFERRLSSAEFRNAAQRLLKGAR